jgi:protein-L-isoaspartate O-methyltransferase
MADATADFWGNLTLAERQRMAARDYDWPRFERELLFRTADPKVLQRGSSGFRAILKELGLPKGCRALDVGAGGFTGATTTKHLIEVLDAEIDAVELIPELVEKLETTYGSRLNVICADIYDFMPSAPYDLVVLDLPIMDKQIDELVPRFLPHVNPGGYFITCMVYDLQSVFDVKEPLLHHARRGEFETFMTQRFGATRLDPVVAQRAFAGTPVTVRAVVDKWLCRGEARGFGWLVLQKNGTHPRARTSLLKRARRALQRILER